MGRKIKGKKHHGTKDPEKQREAREAKIRTKINNRPSQSDVQEIPKSLKTLMKVREDVKSGNLKQRERRRKQKDSDLLDSSKYHTTVEPKQKGMNKPLKPIPVFRQKPGEHKRAFYYRMEQTIQSMKKRASFEEKYKVDVQMDPSGQTKIVDREMDEVEMEVEKKKIEKLAKKGIVVKTKEEKRKAKREREKIRKNKKKGKVDSPDRDFEELQDTVQFGERVDAPPSISLKKFPKSSSKAGSRSLLLNQNKTGDGGVVKKKKKSMAQKVALERDRLKVVEQYRQLKAQK